MSVQLTFGDLAQVWECPRCKRRYRHPPTLPSLRQPPRCNNAGRHNPVYMRAVTS